MVSTDLFGYDPEMSCSHDKVRDYSMERDNTLNIPSYNFYASTLRFLDKFKDCLASVSRPIRRGPYFNNTKAKKPQLTRHYKQFNESDIASLNNNNDDENDDGDNDDDDADDDEQ
ncbi:hypothetical protein KUTeg_009900 [Tegillarca granosa]|uniref:Uncharacterized protein n=1 Tax=Tegillarca granosa TaxID=220873 RepID=A0ABQ9F896_TEGGR|nr:hypothetical protein KUTeg_009900 [Tegillarca granosa]